MKAPDAGRLSAWLADPRVADVDPPTVSRVREQLAAGALRVEVQPHGTVIVRDPRHGEPPRRILELDRGGTLLAALRWTDDGRLSRAWIRIGDGSWASIEPGATREAPWGPSDRLWHAPHPTADPTDVTIFQSLSYEAIDAIPVLAEPARLPAGAGTAVLNLVAGLAADAGRSRLAYRGPYPTERLFLALLESFRYQTAEADPLAAFLGGRIEWSPAPHERVFAGAGATLHLRGRVEAVTWRGRVYHRPDRQGIQRWASRRVRDADGRVVCSLWALGEVVEDHLRIDPGAATVEPIGPAPCDTSPLAMPPAVVLGAAAAAAALGAPALAPFVREAGGACELAWAPVDHDLVAADGRRLRVSHALRDLLVRRLRAADTRALRLAVGLAMLTELAHLFGDVLQARAQERVAALPPEDQARVLTEHGADPDDARRITAAVEALLAQTS